MLDVISSPTCSICPLAHFLHIQLHLSCVQAQGDANGKKEIQKTGSQFASAQSTNRADLMSLMAQSSGLVGRPGNEFDHPAAAPLKLGYFALLEHTQNAFRITVPIGPPPALGCPSIVWRECPTSPPAPWSFPSSPPKALATSPIYPAGPGDH